MASGTFDSGVQQDYEALLIFSAKDEELAKALWMILRNKGYRITQHQDPDGPFMPGSSAYNNMINAIEKSKKLLVLFTKAAVESGYVSLEMMLAIEKSKRTGQMGLQLLAIGLTEDEVGKLKHGLLGRAPHIFVDMNRDRWEETLLRKLMAPMEKMEDLLPAGNLAHGQVFSHFVGYMQHILPVFQEKLIDWKENSNTYKTNPGKVCQKYMMLIPYSCSTDIDLERSYSDCDVTIEHADTLSIEVGHGGKKRVYNLTIYRAKQKDLKEPIYFIGESAKVLHCAWLLKDKKIAEVDTRLEANRFYHTMNNLLNHQENERCNNKTTLLCYQDDRYDAQATHASSAGKVLWNALTQTQTTQQDNDTDGQNLSCFNFLEANTEQYEYDATVLCLSESEDDRKIADDIARYLQGKGKQVIQRELHGGQWKEIDLARWNIFVMSQQSFSVQNTIVPGLDLTSAIERCCRNKCIQILPVITGMRMEEVPDSLKWVTMISTEQQNYKEIILNQMEGAPVHMHQKMPAGDVSTGLARAYSLNYLPIQLGGKTTEKQLDFKGRIKEHLSNKKERCGCLPYFYVILSSTGKFVKQDTTEGPITDLGRAEPPIRLDQAGTKGRPYYINMYKFSDTDQDVCYISEVCTPGITLNSMATDFPFAGIDKGPILNSQIQDLGNLIINYLKDEHYKKMMGDYIGIFRLIRYDVEGGKSLSEVIGAQLRKDMECSDLIKWTD